MLHRYSGIAEKRDDPALIGHAPPFSLSSILGIAALDMSSVSCSWTVRPVCRDMVGGDKGGGRRIPPTLYGGVGG